MQTNHQAQVTVSRKLARLFYVLLFTGSVLLCSRAEARFRFEVNDNDTAEKKVDYLEQLYFSGSDKEELDQDILITIQNIQSKQPTTALAKQLTFLLEVQPKVNEAGSTCDALDLLAVGIYNIDAAEAARQDIKMPSSKAKEKSADAVAALNKLSSSAYNTGSSATGLAWSSIIYSNGKYTSVAAKASKVARAANAAGTAADAAGKALETGRQIKGVADKLGLKIGGKKKKACDNVPQKEIVLGEHKALPAPSEAPVNASQQTTVAVPVTSAGSIKLTIKNVTFNHMGTLKPSIEKMPGVASVSTIGFSENIVVIAIVSSMKADELATKIIEANKSLNLEVAGLSEQEVTLVKK